MGDAGREAEHRSETRSRTPRPFALPDGWTALRGVPTRAPRSFPTIATTNRIRAPPWAAWNLACAAAHPVEWRTSPQAATAAARTDAGLPRDHSGRAPGQPQFADRLRAHAASARLRGARPAGVFPGASPAGRSRSRDTWPFPGPSRGRLSRFARGRRREGREAREGWHGRRDRAPCHVQPASGPASQTGDPPEKRRARDGHGPQR